MSLGQSACHMKMYRSCDFLFSPKVFDYLNFETLMHSVLFFFLNHTIPDPSYTNPTGIGFLAGWQASTDLLNEYNEKQHC